MRVVRVRHSRWRCAFTFPVMSTGDNGLPIIMAEEQCYLERDHDGPHRSPRGGVAANQEQTLRELDGWRKK